VGQSLNNLGLLYKMQSRYAEAEVLYQQALAIWEKSLGLQHPNVATVLENMAALHKATGNAQQADEFLKRARKIRRGANQ
jgi:tetratricopeptide (TPR) repeat protein